MVEKLKLPKNEISFQSQLTPSMIVNLDEKQIYKVAKSSEVISIDYFDDCEMAAPLCENQQQTMRVNKAREQFGLTGNGVNVLMNDHGCVRSDADGYELISNPDKIKVVVDGNIYSTTNTSVMPGSSANTHPNLISAEMQSFSPNVNIYSVGYGCYADVEWALLNCNINLINGSINLGTSSTYNYDSIAKWYDAIVSIM